MSERHPELEPDPFDEAPMLFARLDAGDPAILQSVLRFGGAS